MAKRIVLTQKRFFLWIQQYKKCFYCGAELTFKESTVDHKLPRARGGKSNIENLVCSCQKCNSKKSITDQPNYKVFPKWWPQYLK
jgi:5-methylcytosine-specific restriction endonuclease McrA